MDFIVSPEHEQFQAMLRSFFDTEAPTRVVAELDREERFPTEIYAKMAGMGLRGLTFDEKYGGSAADEISICIAAEEVSRASATIGYAYIPTVTFCARGIARFGTEEQKRAYLPEIAAGRMRLAMGLTEPDAGSDLASLSTRAVRDGSDFIVSGQKVFTTGADTADFILTFVRSDPDAPPRHGLSVLLIPREAEGVTVRPLRKLAGQGTHTCEVFFEDVRIPGENLVGEYNRGLDIIFGLLDGERIYVGAQGCGLGQAALDMALRYAQNREQFGQPIIEFQGVAHMLADMAIEIEMARLLTWRAAWKLDNGIPCSKDASMVKVAGSETGTRCALKGMQILGGYSYIVDYGMERIYRETKLYEIAGGTNQIQRNIIVKHLRAGA
ncbi:MAG: acyl-CoA dehydrogenase family protein [Acidimicrobiia bacterium]